MQFTPLQYMDGIARRAVPFGLTFLLMLFAMTPAYVPGLFDVTPMFTLICVFFWSIHRVDLLGYATIFGIGIFEDLLMGTPLGSGSLVLLLCQWFVVHQQKFLSPKPFVVTWMAFAIIALGACIIRWLCVGFVSPGGFTPINNLVPAYLLSIAIYPLLAWMLAKIYTKLLADIR